MEFSWDPKIAEDPYHSDKEDRLILIGHSSKDNLLFVVHLYKESNEQIRITSARRATRKEKKVFAET